MTDKEKLDAIKAEIRRKISQIDNTIAPENEKEHSIILGELLSIRNFIKSLDEHSDDITENQDKNEHKPAWSEEDETFTRDAVAAAEEYYTKGCGQEELVVWLKSIKGRVQSNNGICVYNPEKSTTFDRQSFRAEAAKDILCAVLLKIEIRDGEDFQQSIENIITNSINTADKLIKQLKEKEEDK